MLDLNRALARWKYSSSQGFNSPFPLVTLWLIIFLIYDVFLDSLTLVSNFAKLKIIGAMRWKKERIFHPIVGGTRESHPSVKNFAVHNEPCWVEDDANFDMRMGIACPSLNVVIDFFSYSRKKCAKYK